MIVSTWRFATFCAVVFLAFASAAFGVVLIDLKDVKAGSIAAEGCSWNASKNVLTLAAGDYFVSDSAWNEKKPKESGSFYNANPGLSIVLEGDCTMTVENVVAVSGKSENGVNSVVDLNGHDLALTLSGENRFYVKVETKNIGPAICVPKDSTLVIDGDGSLDAYVYGGGAATIGSRHAEDSGRIRICGGAVIATHANYSSCRIASGLNGAAIGSGAAANAGAIEISGGSVTATSEAWAAAIGAGANYDGVEGAGAFDVTVAGGTVVATGGTDGGSGIGGGHSYSRADETGACAKTCPIRILGGTVSAVAGMPSSHDACSASAIGASMRGAGAAVVIDASATVTANAASTKNGTLVQGLYAMTPGSLEFSCAAKSSDGHAFLSTTATAAAPDVHPADSSSVSWSLATNPGVVKKILRAANASKGVDYSLEEGPVKLEFGLGIVVR